MKFKIVITFVFVLFVQLIVACPACEKQQPKMLQGITHGGGPQSNWDWVIIAVISLITLLTLIFSIKYLVKPGETNSDHIKKSILSNW